MMSGNSQEPIGPEEHTNGAGHAKEKQLSIGKKFWIGVAAVFVFMAVISVAFGGSGGKGKSNTAATTIPTEAMSADTSETPTPATLPHDLTGITVSYSGGKSDGTVINDQTPGIIVAANYTDGITETPSGWKVNNPGVINMNGPQDFIIEYQGKQAKLTLQADVPIEYQNALEKASQYSEMMHMSRQGIYEQLTSQYGEQFNQQAAQYAVDHLNADYNANALAKAQDYQSQMSMSTNAIRDQLTSQYGEKFTQSEADYAIQHLNG
jgi:hypothetical protein